MVETTIDLEATDNHEYIVRSNYTEELQQVKERLDELKAQLPSLWSRAASDLGLIKDKTLKMEHDSRWGYVFRVTRKDEKVLSLG